MDEEIKRLESLRTTPKDGKICINCLKPIANQVDPWQPECAECLESARQERIRERVRHRQELYEKTCPVIFRETDLEKLPNRKAYDLAVQNNARSLLLHGLTGTGKSRAGWEIVRLSMMDGKSVKILDSTAGIRFASKFSDGSETVESWLDALCETELVFLDDVFKNKMTDAFEGFIYSIIDQRMNNRRQLIASCNDTGESLSNRLTSDRAEPFIRRLRESCMAIQF